jgi:multiple sugar transport system substrate-binding protein
MSARLSRRSFMKSITAGAGLMAASAWLAGCAAPPAAAPAAEAGGTGRRFEGRNLSVAGMSWMWEGTKPFYEQYLEDTGINLEIASFQQQEITDKLMQSVATSTYFADLVGVESNVSADIWGAGACLEVPEDIVSDPAMDWEDVLPVYRDKILSWEGKVYGMPFDGDTHHMMYLHSLFENPDNQQNFHAKYGYDLDPATGPKTWDEHRDIAEFFTGWDWNEDGEENFGFAHMMKRADTAFWGFISRSTAYAKHPDDPGFFFDLDTAEPRINSPAFVRALTEWKDEMQFAPPGVLSYGWGEVIQASQAGRVAMNVGWDGVAMYGEGSTIKGQCSFNVLPGSYEVYNAKEGGWESRPDINYAPYLAFGGWLISVAKGTENPDAAFDLAKYLTNKENGNRLTFEGFKNPIRASEVNDATPWIEGKLQMSEQSANTYVRALNDTMTHPNLVLCLRMPGWTQYRDALELAVSKALAGEADPQAALDEAAATWSSIMDRLGGPERQIEFYKLHLGL